jgi:signal transduction histidine kinase
MWWLASSDAELRREYRDDLRARRMPDAVRTAARVVFTLNLAFTPLDAFAYPEKFQSFLIARMALNAVLAVLYFGTSRRHPVFSQSALCLATGGLLLWVIYGSGAATGDYYVGLVLALVGLPVLLPLDPLRAAGMWSLLVGAFLASPLFAAGPMDMRTFVIHGLFLVSGAFTGVASAAYLDRARLREFAQLRQIEKANEDLKETDRIKSRFTANVHHELRTPLTLTLAPLEAILSGEFGVVPESLLDSLRTMHVNALRLLKLINNLLDLAKVENRRMQLRRRELDLARVVDDIVTGARPLAKRKGVALVTDPAADLPRACVDEDGFEKIVVNLLGNALKFTDRGGEITLGLAPHPDGVQLRIADTGMGIPADQLERIFDRFAQVDTSATRKFEGTGIGLSLVKELAELHGGRVWAESPGLGAGTCMNVVLPLGEPDDGHDDEVLRDADGAAVPLRQALDGMAAELDLEGEASPSFLLSDLERNVQRWEGGHTECADRASALAPKIVVAEDNADMRKLFETLLGREYRVRVTRNGREALEAVREDPPDLVLTDVMMPEMSGVELCRALKEDPQTQGIPVVLVTSKADREMKIQGLEIGADDYVAKPFHPRELMARVRALVRLRSLQAELAARNARLEEALGEVQAAEVQLVQAERLAAVGQLAAGVAHEVNNPVNFALNAARALEVSVEEIRPVTEALGQLDWRDTSQLIAQLEKLRQLDREYDVEGLAGRIAELVGIVTDGLVRTERMVGDLRDFAGSRRGGSTPVDVRRSLASTLRLIGPSFQAEGIQVESRFEDDLPPTLADAGALNQVFLNLLKNAAEALGGRGGRIAVRAWREHASLVVEIEDDGPGVADEIRDQLFEPFVTTKRAGQGSGLGLSISRRIVSGHGGSIELRSAPGGGTIARVTLLVAS